MALEFSASRLLGNVFGTSNIVWAVVIGLILVYLSIGYWLGGRLADRRPEARLLYSLIGLAGLFTAAVPLISRPVLRVSATAFDALDLPLLAGSFTAVVLLLTVPVVLLGTVVPFSLRLALPDAAYAGRTSGLLSALSTAGSFIGTFLTVLVLIPALGTYRSFLLIAGLLLLLSSLGFTILREKRFAAVAIIALLTTLILFTLGPRGQSKTTAGLIYEGESAYNYIQVVERDGYRYLRLNEGQGIHSIWHPQDLFYGGPWCQFLIAPLFNPDEQAASAVDQIAILGLAAGTSARQAAMAYPQAKVMGVELDPEILRVGERYFGLGEIPQLESVAGDARWEITKNEAIYDLIIVDAYRPPYIPAHLVTVEFFETLRQRLSSWGMVSINVGRSPNDYSLVDALAATMGQVFPQVFAVELPEAYNTILFAAVNPEASWANFEANAKRVAAADPSSVLAQASELALQARAAVNPGDLVFTDDQAPIEWMTNRLVLNFLFEEKP